MPLLEGSGVRLSIIEAIVVALEVEDVLLQGLPIDKYVHLGDPPAPSVDTWAA